MTNSTASLIETDDNETQQTDTNKPSSFFASVTQSLKSFASVSQIMRVVGAAGVLLSMSLFLMQGWSEHNDLERFFTMLMQTVLLGGAGFALFKLLKETKGARLFFGLSLASITANFTTLSALIYSLFQWDTLSASYPEYAHWVISDVGKLSLCFGVAAVVLVPLSYFAFAVLTRPAAKQMTVAFLAVNGLLLLPVREVRWIIPIVVVAIICLVRLFSTQLRMMNGDTKQYVWATNEGKLTRLVLLAPPIIMLVRTLLHYDVSSFSAFILCAAGYFLLVESAKLCPPKLSSFIHFVGLCLALVGSFILSFAVLEPLLAYQWATPTAITFFCAACYYSSLASDTDRVKSIGWVFAVSCTVISLCLNQLTVGHALTAIFSVAAGALICYLGFKKHSNYALLAGALLMIGVSTLYIGDMTTLLFNSGWIGFAIGGASVIVLASVLDRYGAIIKHTVTKGRAISKS